MHLDHGGGDVPVIGTVERRHPVEVQHYHRAGLVGESLLSFEQSAACNSVPEKLSREIGIQRSIAA